MLHASMYYLSPSKFTSCHDVKHIPGTGKHMKEDKFSSDVLQCIVNVIRVVEGA